MIAASPRFQRTLASLAATLLFGFGVALCLSASVPSVLAAEPTKLANTSRPAGPYRAVVPGVEVTIAPDRQEEETFTTRDIVEIITGIPGLDWKPKLAPESRTLREMATQTEFRRDIWCLEFTFKPVRMIWVDVPQRSGKMQKKLIWYMVYHVKNTGKHLAPGKQKDGTYKVSPMDQDIRFFPQLVLESPEYNKAYLDRIIPLAIPAIERKEDPNRKLLNSVDISSKRIPVSDDLIDRSVWGVATWEDVDPRIDTFAVYVQGLTNAYHWVDTPGVYKHGDPPGTGRVLTQKTLMLNFWRPGDEFVEDQRIIRYGAPGQVDYSWVYR